MRALAAGLWLASSSIVPRTSQSTSTCSTLLSCSKWSRVMSERAVSQWLTCCLETPRCLPTSVWVIWALWRGLLDAFAKRLELGPQDCGHGPNSLRAESGHILLDRAYTDNSG